MPQESRIREFVDSARSAVRGAGLGLRGGQRLLPSSEAVTRAVALAAVADEDYVHAHKRLARADIASIEYAEAHAAAVLAYAEVARRVAARSLALANNPGACGRIVTEARTEQRGLGPYWFGPYVVGLAVGILAGFVTNDAKVGGIAFAVAWFASVLVGAAVARLRRRAFTHDVAMLIDSEVSK